MNNRQLFERHYPSLVWFLEGRLGDRDLAEDLAQEAFVRLIDKPPREPDAWLYVVAGNLARDAQRGELRRAHRLVVMRADDVSCRELAATIRVSPASIGPLVARAQQRFIRALAKRTKDRGSDARASS